MSYYIPLLLVVLSNTFYHISAKSTPADANTFASLSVSYTVAAVCSLLLFFITGGTEGIADAYRRLNWSSLVLGLTVVGLEAGFILMYKAGWSVSTAQIVQSALLAVVLIAVEYLLYREAITVKKLMGILICVAGLYLLNQ